MDQPGEERKEKGKLGGPLPQYLVEIGELRFMVFLPSQEVLTVFPAQGLQEALIRTLIDLVLL